MEDVSIGTILFLVILVICSAFFSAAETAFSSINRSRLKSMSQSGDKKAKRALELSENYDRLLSTILIADNLVNIMATAIATVTLVGMVEHYGLLFAIAVTAAVILLLGEVSPKAIAEYNAERFAITAAPLLLFTVKLFYPLVFLFDLWKRLLGVIFKSQRQDGITEDELMILVDEAENDGGINESEGDLIRAVIEFNDLYALDILTHRMDVSAVEDTDTVEQIASTFAETGFSRLPVYHETIDNVVGIIHEKDFHMALRQGRFRLDSIVKQPLFITESTKISELLRQLQQNKMHMAIVVDEFGGTAGLITLEDVLEELVGDIWDEHDDVIEDIRKTDDETYIVNCSTALTDLLEHFSITEEYDTVTVGGWVMQMLSKVPVVGDNFTYENMTVTVTQIDNRRPLEIQIKLRETPAEAE